MTAELASWLVWASGDDAFRGGDACGGAEEIFLSSSVPRDFWHDFGSPTEVT